MVTRGENDGTSLRSSCLKLFERAHPMSFAPNPSASLAIAVHERLRQAASRELRAQDPAGRFWRISDPPLFGRDARQRRTHVDAVKRAVLTLLAKSETAVIFHPDSPIDDALPGTWVPVGAAGVWRFPPDVELADRSTAHWLFSLGSWTICAPADGLDTVPDLFHEPPPDLLEWMERVGLSVVVQSGPDDVEWVLALHRTPS
jgi:hypothetical protein